MAKKEYKIQEITPVQPPAPEAIPGITVPKVNYGTAIGGVDAPEDGATNNSAQIVNGVLVTDVANDQFDTSTNEILGEFTFGASGAIKVITDANNGLWISPTGILGKKAGVTTFAVDASGNASFRGTVVITGGSGIASLTDSGDLATLDAIGASNCDTTIISGGRIITGLLTADNVQAGTLTGRTVRTASSGARAQLDGANNIISIFDASRERIRLNQQNLYFYNESGNTIGQIYSDSSSNLFINAPSGNYLVLNAAGSSYAIVLRNASNDIAYINSSGIDLASGKEIDGQYAHLDCIVVGNNSPLTETGAIYCDGTHFYGRIGSTWKQLDN